MRALEVGTWDGFWAFEMEKRGAEVVALDLDIESDLDWPPRRRPAEWSTEMRGDGFRLAKQIRGSKVERVDLSIYHATPEELGTFDLVFCGSVLIHLRDQLLALERIANLCTDVHHRRGVRPADQPAAVPGLALSRRPRQGRRLLAPERSDLEADDVDGRLRPGRAPRQFTMKATDGLKVPPRRPSRS